MSQSGMCSPVKTAQDHVTVGGAKMDIVCSQFGGTFFILITDMNKMGTLMAVNKETQGPQSPSIFSVRTLLGHDEPDVHVFGRAIGECVLSSSPSSLMLGLGVRHPNPSSLPQLLPTIKQLVDTIQQSSAR